MAWGASCQLGELCGPAEALRLWPGEQTPVESTPALSLGACPGFWDAERDASPRVAAVRQFLQTLCAACKELVG